MGALVGALVGAGGFEFNMARTPAQDLALFAHLPDFVDFVVAC